MCKFFGLCQSVPCSTIIFLFQLKPTLTCHITNANTTNYSSLSASCGQDGARSLRCEAKVVALSLLDSPRGRGGSAGERVLCAEGQSGMAHGHTSESPGALGMRLCSYSP